MLEHFFGSKTRLKLLKVFFRSPERPFFVRELARLVETQLNAVRRELENLERMDLLTPVPFDEVAIHDGGTERSKFYRLNTLAPLYPELRALLMKGEMLLEQELIDELKEKAGDITLFFLTGIFTHETDVSTDILLVGKLKPLVVNKLIKRYEEETDKEVRYTLMDEREFKDRREIGDRFLFTVFESKHIPVINTYRL